MLFFLFLSVANFALHFSSMVLFSRTPWFEGPVASPRVSPRNVARELVLHGEQRLGDQLIDAIHVRLPVAIAQRHGAAQLAAGIPRDHPSKF